MGGRSTTAMEAFTFSRALNAASSASGERVTATGTSSLPA
jgi:hypothetical protein